uniref:Proline dehydrogenase n=2 Tax=Corvus moneduloides TaxID=1196302 RepID=A0A8C3GYU1_CORMO
MGKAPARGLRERGALGRVAPVLVLAPVTVPVPVRIPVSVLVSIPVSVLVAVLLPTVVPVPVPVSVPVLVPVPVQVRVLVPLPFSVPVPVSVPDPFPVPLPVPVLVSVPVPESVPVPIPVAVLMPVSVPVPLPFPVPLPVPESVPVPVPGQCRGAVPVPVAAERSQRRGGAGPRSWRPGGGPARAVLKAVTGSDPAVPMGLPSAARVLRAAVRRCDPPSRPRSAPAGAPRGSSPAAASTGPRPGPPPPPRGAERSPPPPAVDFGDAREAFRSKSSVELLRGLVVLGLCAVEPLVQHNRELLQLCQRVLGQTLFERLMKMTFYGQFVAGEDQEAIKPLLRRNQAFGVGAVLDYSVEEDLGDGRSRTSAAEKEMGGAEQREKQYRAHQGFGDHRGGVTGAHTYFYADEAKCDQHMETFLHCIDASSGSSEDGFSAIKLTALARPQFLVRFSEVLVKWRRFFHQMAAEQGQAGWAVLDTKLEVEKLQEALANLGIVSKAESQQWFTGKNVGTSGTVDLLDWNSLFDSRTKLSRPLLIPNRKTGQLEPLLSRFSKEEELQMKRMLQRMDVLAKRAMEKGVRLMVDAEQSYFQPAISRLTVETQRRFNRSQPIIYNTYQCYLKEAYNNVTGDVELSRREGWHFGTKLVRGAYMEQERERAAQMGYEDPINPNYEKTNEMYHRCLDYVLEEIKHSQKASVMVASHNEDTVKFTLRRMMELGIHPSDKKVCFGQLLGMCDQITFPLGQAGFPVYKYVPYGPVNEVLPYLSRRAQENRGFMQRANRERDLLWKEVKRRLLTGNLFSH